MSEYAVRATAGTNDADVAAPGAAVDVLVTLDVRHNRSNGGEGGEEQQVDQHAACCLYAACGHKAFCRLLPVCQQLPETLAQIFGSSDEEEELHQQRRRDADIAAGSRLALCWAPYT